MRSRRSTRPGEVIEVTQHDGSVLRLRKLAEGYDPGDRLAAMNHIATYEARGEVLTGLLYVNTERRRPARPPATRSTRPLNRLGDAELCPGAAALEAINAELV